MGFLKELVKDFFDPVLNMKEYADTGSAGEQYTFRAIKPIFGENRIFRNVYIPKSNGQTTEIDLLAIHQSGIYVFESKNYSGWIFGDANSSQWTQSLQGGYKNKFYNPVWQNNAHIKALQVNLSQYKNAEYYSYIVFSERCTLKNITCKERNVFILKRDDLWYSLKKRIVDGGLILANEQLEAMAAFLLAHQRPDYTVKIQHLADVEESLMLCPWCKGALVERYNSKTGNKFYGCKNYPRCKYTRTSL